MTRTGAIISSLAAAAMLALCADGPAIAEQSSKPKPGTRTYSKTLTFTISTTQGKKPGQKMKAKTK
jgi:hypothetical protein